MGGFESITSSHIILTSTRKFGIIFIAEDDGYTFLQMRSMYCFVEYKMLLFNPTLQETIGDDIIYIISKPPKDSAYGSYRSKTELQEDYLCLCTDTGMVYFGYPFFLFKMKNWYKYILRQLNISFNNLQSLMIDGDSNNIWDKWANYDNFSFLLFQKNFTCDRQNIGNEVTSRC